MPSLSLIKPPDPYQCRICERPSLVMKAGPGCEKCPAFKETHYFPRSMGPDAADIVIIGDVAQEPPDRKIERELERGASAHEAFTDDGSIVLQRAIDDAITRFLGAKAGVSVKYIYAIRCAADNPNKAVMSSCQGPMLSDLSRVNSERQRVGKTGKLVIIACGTMALRSLGVHVTSFEDAAGHVFDTTLGDVPVAIIPTLSLAALAAASGKYSSVLADVDRALRVLTNTQIQVIPREQLEQGYIYPKSIEEVRQLVAMVRDYSGPRSTPAKWAISLDTETNTLHPHRPTLKLLAVSFAWDDGLAAAVALWHPGNTYYDPYEAYELLRPLIEGDKPKILHNGKYDLKVFWRVGSDIGNMVWDCMLAEHALEEDKKGQYGLKYLVRQFLPAYSGYEDKLHDLLEQHEGTDQRQSIDRELAARPITDTLPQPILAALNHLEVSPKFRVTTLEKSLALYKSALDRGMPQEVVRTRGLQMADRVDEVTARIRSAELLIAAKKAGEFSERKKEKKADKREEDGGFERIPLPELLFYAAVDADATRRLSIMQFRRMWQEDQELEAKRAELSFTMKLDPKLKRYSIMRRYEDTHPPANGAPTPSPIPQLVKGAYVPRSRVLARMEYDGIKVDRDYLHDADVKLTQVIHEQEERIFELAGARFNLGSTSQLGSYLFNTGVGYRHPEPSRALALASEAGNEGLVLWRDGPGRVMYSPISYTQRGAAQVNEATLKTYMNKYDCPFAEAVLLYRKATKAKETFLVNVDRLSQLDGFLHTSYNLHGTGTGRLSSTNLNMQNTPKGEMGGIPDKDPRAKHMSKAERAGVKCKKLFVPHASDMVFVNCDAKGAEVSVFSGYARDKALIEALRGGMDAHCFFSSKVLDPDKVAAGKTGNDRKLALAAAGIDDVHAWTYNDFLLGKDGLLPDDAYNKRLKKLRDNIKRVVFGILYGAGPSKIADIAGIDKVFAQTIIELLFGMFPSLPLFVEQVQFEVEHLGVVETYHGRRRRFSIKHAPPKLLAQAKRRGVNFDIQAENSDIVLDVLTRVAPIIQNDLGGRLYLTVHDSIGFGVPYKYVTQVKDIMHREGTLQVAKDNPWLPVDYKWDCEYGWSYGTVDTLDKFLNAYPQPDVEDSGALVEEEILDELRSAVLEHAEQQ